MLLTHKLAKGTKEAITSRIKEVEATLCYQPLGQTTKSTQTVIRPPKTAQSPSTQRILDEMAAEGQQEPVNDRIGTPMASGPNATPQGLPIAQTPAAAAALAARQDAINIAISGREEKGRTSPRKF